MCEVTLSAISISCKELVLLAIAKMQRLINAMTLKHVSLSMHFNM